uniref:FAD-dependent oxidoreductase n=1 Tax=Bacillus sp. JCM 19041 TaxID=1460637 RepID=UPI0006D236A4
NKAIIKRNGEERSIEADYIIGAEGLSSKIRTHINATRPRELYNHDFLTVSFPGPSELSIGEMISTQDRFLGLFPLPNNDVRTVYLVRKGEFKEMRKRSLDEFHRRYLSLYPELDGYVQKVQSWKDIQLMVPIKQHASHYVKGHFALIGDAAHSVHPMAGEGMNLAIQDADVLGELIGDMYEANQQHDPNRLRYYEQVRRIRVSAILRLSHLGGLVYGRSGAIWQKNRSFFIKRLIQNKTLLSKYMFNISGLGVWPFSINEVIRLFKSENEQSLQQKMNKRTFTEEADYPWKKKMR